MTTQDHQSAIRRQLGVVLQNGRITSASLLENTAAGALITLDDAWEAARRRGRTSPDYVFAAHPAGTERD